MSCIGSSLNHSVKSVNLLIRHSHQVWSYINLNSTVPALNTYRVSVVRLTVSKWGPTNLPISSVVDNCHHYMLVLGVFVYSFVIVVILCVDLCLWHAFVSKIAC